MTIFNEHLLAEIELLEKIVGTAFLFFYNSYNFSSTMIHNNSASCFHTCLVISFIIILIHFYSFRVDLWMCVLQLALKSSKSYINLSFKRIIKTDEHLRFIYVNYKRGSNYIVHFLFCC